MYFKILENSWYNVCCEFPFYRNRHEQVLHRIGAFYSSLETHRTPPCVFHCEAIVRKKFEIQNKIFVTSMLIPIPMPPKRKFSVKDFFGKCDQILNGELHFCTVYAQMLVPRFPNSSNNINICKWWLFSLIRL